MGMMNYLLLVLLLIGTYSQATTLTFGVVDGVDKEPAYSTLKAAYAKHGITIELRPLPGQRGLIEANAGRIDGELIRATIVEKTNKNLIRVTPAVAEIKILAFAKNPKVKVPDGWPSLAPYNIVLVNGIKISEQATKGMNRQFANNLKAAFTMVNMGRADVTVANEATGLKIIADQGFTDIRPIKPPIARTLLYHYLHVKHRDLAEKISRTLQSKSR